MAKWGQCWLVLRDGAQGRGDREGWKKKGPSKKLEMIWRLRESFIGSQRDSINKSVPEI
jgi:hypothetical protein